MVQLNKNILKDEIQWLLEAIDEQFIAIRSYEGKVPQIEFDIILENLRKVYENFHLLQRTDDPYTYLEEKSNENSVIKPVIQMNEIEYEPASESGEDSHPEQTVDERKEPLRIVESPKPLHPSAEKEGGSNLFTGTQSDFEDKLKESHEKNIRPKMHQEKSDHLKSYITINDKFLIINELFGGNLREYNETIETLNGFQDLRTAMEFTDLLRRKNLWDAESNGFIILKDLIGKRLHL